MRPSTSSSRVTATVLSLLLVSCGATRSITPTHPDELTQFVLFVQDRPDGTATHSWRRAEELDLSRYRQLAGARGAARHIVLAMGRKRDCDAENRECIRECMNRPLARGFGHITSGNRKKGGKEAYCVDQCMQPYFDCKELQERKPHEFTAVDSAVDWLKSNRRSILLGSVVLIAGVAFIAISAGAGALVLAPALLLTTPGAGVEAYMAEVSP